MDFSKIEHQSTLAKAIAPIFKYGNGEDDERDLGVRILEDEEFWKTFDTVWLPCTIFLLKRAYIREKDMYWKSLLERADKKRTLELREKKTRTKTMMKHLLELAKLPNKATVKDLEGYGVMEWAVIFLNYLHAGMSVGAEPFLDDFTDILEKANAMKAKNSGFGDLH